MLRSILGTYFNVDSLSATLLVLVLFVSVNIYFFSRRYLQGDTYYLRFLSGLLFLSISLIVLVSADYLPLFLLAWFLSNFLLSRLMIHKMSWKAAKASGRLANRTALFSVLCLASAFLGLFFITGETGIQAILNAHPKTPLLLIPLLFMILSAMAQSAIFPFHRYLLSSLNSPTPISAIMHAGLINGGGLLLIRFAPLYLREPFLLDLIFMLGLLTAVIGTLFKLVQNDNKRMLACSTMSQMGFMFAQCGLGLFPAALAHLFWHGLFKAYLFLSSGNAAKEKRLDKIKSPDLSHFIFSVFMGLIGAFFFALFSGKNIFSMDTTLFLIGIAFIACMQFSLTLLSETLPFKYCMAVFLSIVAGAIYGLSVGVMQIIISSLDLSVSRPLNIFNITGFILLSGLWLVLVFEDKYRSVIKSDKKLGYLYMFLLNQSQPSTKTITTDRTDYHYID